jgi:Rrf2 family nitric oxide-sensitive transcriptional repressor
VRFRLQTDYALKALLFLATRNGANSTTEEIARFYDISAAHLGRVIRKLQKQGLVKAIRGRRGGVLLNRDPSELTLGEVVDWCEDGGSLAPAAEHEMPEATTHTARMRAVLRRGQGLFLNYLRKVTFTELAGETGDVLATSGVHPERFAPTSHPAPQPEPAGVGPVQRESAFDPARASSIPIAPRDPFSAP